MILVMNERYNGYMYAVMVFGVLIESRGLLYYCVGCYLSCITHAIRYIVRRGAQPRADPPECAGRASADSQGVPAVSVD